MLRVASAFGGSVLAGALGVACGDPIVGPKFLGTPALELRGTVLEVERREGEFPVSPLRLSLFWIGLDSRERQRPTIEQEAEVDSGLASFQMALFDAPPDDALLFSDLARPGEGEIGIALIVLYADNNANGALNSYSPREEGPDTVLGASARHLVAYATEALGPDGEAARLLGSIERGYHLFSSTAEATCRFVSAEDCSGEGSLVQVPIDEPVTISVYANPGSVLVPSPTLRPASSGSEGTSLYGPR